MVKGVVPRLMLGVESWCSWDIQNDGSVCTRYSEGEVQKEENVQPRLESVPPMQRRRLSPMARVAFHVLSQCTSTDAQEPLIFSSVMGEICRTQNILDSLAVDDAVSPAAFSLSVHNSVAGLWSLVRGDKAPMLSLAPIANSPVPALLEAAGALAEDGCKSVLVVYCEENLPEFYWPFMAGPLAPTALALRLVSAKMQPGDLTLSLKQSDIEPACDPLENRKALAGLLRRDTPQVTVAEPQSLWQLTIEG